jgi:hypothetical protein
VLHRTLTLLLASLFLGSGVLAQVPQPGVGTSARPPVPASRGPLPVFALYSGFWINLHHVLYQQARLHSRRAVTRAQGGIEVQGGELALDALTEQERRDWNLAIDIYEQEVAGHDLQFDRDLVLMNNRLAEMGEQQGAEATGFTRDVITALAKAAPVYRAHWWTGDDRSNRDWIDAVAPLVEQMGAQIARQLSAIYQAPWPKEHIHVDVCVYAGVFGGYATDNPLHITVSSRDSRNQGLSALEVLFHEASHGLADPVREAINREFLERHRPIPRDLWHALLFYTTGDVVRRMLEDTGHAEYLPYAKQNGLYVRDWQGYEKALDRDWRPYLENRITFAASIRRLAGEL